MSGAHDPTTKRRVIVVNGGRVCPKPVGEIQARTGVNSSSRATCLISLDLHSTVCKQPISNEINRRAQKSMHKLYTAAFQQLTNKRSRSSNKYAPGTIAGRILLQYGP